MVSLSHSKLCLWAVMAALLLVQNVHPAIGYAVRVQRREANDEVRLLAHNEADESNHRIQKRSIIGAGLKFVFKNFWDDLLCLGNHLASLANCNSLSPGACQRLKDLETKRDEIATLVNQTLEKQVEWATLNSTDEKAITNLQLIEKDLELVTSSNLRLMGILKAISVIEETDTVYDSATDNVTEIRIRFQIDLETYLNGVKATLASAGSQIDSLKERDYVMFAIMTSVPLVALHTGHIVTSARQAFLTRSQSYQVVDIVGGNGRMKLAYNPKGRLYIVQESPELGKLKVLQSVSDNGKVGRFWKFMTPAGQSAMVSEFLESFDFERGKKIAWLQQRDPDYLDTLKQKGYVTSFLSRTEGLSSRQFDDFVQVAKDLDQDRFYRYDNDIPEADLPRQLRLGLDMLNPNDIAMVNAYQRLKATHPDLLDNLNRAGATGNFLENSKTLTDAEFDAYAAKVKAAAPELPDGNLKHFDWDVPAKKVTFTQRIKSGWSSFRNLNLFNWRGRQVKVSNVLTMGTVGGSLNVALCLYMTISSTKSVEEKITEINNKLDEAKTSVETKKAELDDLLVEEKNLYAKIKNNTLSLYNLFSTADGTIAGDPSCQDTLCIFLRDAAKINFISDFLSTWNKDTVTSSSILVSQLSFMKLLEDSKTEMIDLYNSAIITTNVINWVTDGLTLDRMLENAVSLNLDARLPDKFSVLTVIKVAFPSLENYDGIPLRCIGGSITTQAELEAYLNQAAPITGDVVDDIKTGKLFGVSPDIIVVMITSKVDSGDLPANPCNGQACTRDDVLKVIAAEYPTETTYNGEDLTKYRNAASCTGSNSVGQSKFAPQTQGQFRAQGQGGVLALVSIATILLFYY
ncbi:uncharacterized protein LOC106167940 [Lingula anatina]|uniref:Uncharacterized protein LOC106167940 n=1 Tax=Lingula anatina TaxID=7574 RepID=A0A1S3IW58_LINAN|nr:uncharacterized protein LOC106167940 [Lingula anatina]|eukprot:XP_013402298.1 uncharacterized protein LOC106167940 [Lingula anatina]